MPTRRSVLSALPAAGLSLAGCLSPPTAEGPRLRIVDRDDQPSLPLDIDVRVSRGAATADHPPGVRAAVTNTGDEEVRLGEARAVVFAYQYAADAALMLLPDGNDYPAAPGCWRLTEAVGVTEEYRIRSLAPGETMAASLSVYATENAPGNCLPRGEHRFGSRYTLDPDGEDQQEFDWGFTVSLD